MKTVIASILPGHSANSWKSWPRSSSWEVVYVDAAQKVLNRNISLEVNVLHIQAACRFAGQHSACQVHRAISVTLLVQILCVHFALSFSASQLYPFCGRGESYVCWETLVNQKRPARANAIPVLELLEAGLEWEDAIAGIAEIAT